MTTGDYFRPAARSLLNSCLLGSPRLGRSHLQGCIGCESHINPGSWCWSLVVMSGRPPSGTGPHITLLTRESQ